MKKTGVLKRLTFCMIGLALLPITATAVGVNDLINNVPATSQAYPELHLSNNAKQAYDSFVAGARSDPFSDLVSGYSLSYQIDKRDNVEAYRKAVFAEKSAKQFSSNSDFFENNLADRSARKNEIYQQARNSNGEFDPVLYSQLYAAFIANQRVVSSEHLESGFNNLITIIDETNAPLRKLSQTVSYDTALATTYLVDALNSNSFDKRSPLFNEFLNAKNARTAFNNQAQSALTIASAFLGECGSACTFPPVVTPTPPVGSQTGGDFAPPTAPVITPTPAPIYEDCYGGYLRKPYIDYDVERRILCP